MTDKTAELIAALEGLESANDELCRLRTREIYLAMIDANSEDALESLDMARRNARKLIRQYKSAAPAEAVPSDTQTRRREQFEKWYMDPERAGSTFGYQDTEEGIHAAFMSRSWVAWQAAQQAMLDDAAQLAASTSDDKAMRKPEAWMTPSILSFAGAKTNYPESMQSELEGTVMWSPNLIGDAPAVTDKFGITHRPYPLYK